MHNQTSSLESSHFPVMLDEVVKICSPIEGGIYVDCTFGGGSYSKKILKFSETKVIAIDRDKFILSIAKKLEEKNSKRFSFYQKKFSEVDTVVKNQKVDAVIFDLGLSSIQLNNLKIVFYLKTKEALDLSMWL